MQNKKFKNFSPSSSKIIQNYLQTLESSEYNTLYTDDEVTIKIPQPQNTQIKSLEEKPPILTKISRDSPPLRNEFSIPVHSILSASTKSPLRQIQVKHRLLPPISPKRQEIVKSAKRKKQHKKNFSLESPYTREVSSIRLEVHNKVSSLEWPCFPIHFKPDPLRNPIKYLKSYF